MKLTQLLLLTVVFWGVFPCSASALQPEEILLVANRNVSASVELARYYQKRRQVPAENLLQVRMSDAEDCSREDYRRQLVETLRSYLAERPGQIRCLLLFYGVPLRVAPPELSRDEWKHLGDLKFKKKNLDWKIEYRSQAKAIKLWQEESKQLDEKIKKYAGGEEGASVDSELTLLLNDGYKLDKWLPNPYFVGFKNSQEELPFKKDQVLMVARLDASSPEIVRRMIDDSLQVEKKGLTGRAYFDARWEEPQGKKLTGYALYDASLHKAAKRVSQLSRLPVTLDQQGELLQPGSAPDAALYSGWYSFLNYVDAFDWRPGAVAFHIASGECITLKKPGSQVWCKRLLEDGVAATLGPVAEPYVHAFPLPEIFFTYLLDGYYTLVESYFLSSSLLSWQMVLIGDPLYRPFRNRL